MCYAAAIPWVMGAVSAAGAYSAAAGQKASARYQAQVAANNATLAERQATDAKARGDTAAAEMRRRYAATEGAQRAGFSARGIDISDGSANAALRDTSYFGLIDEATIRDNAAREAWGYRTRGANFTAEAGAYSAQAGAINPLLSAGMAGFSGYLDAGGELPGDAPPGDGPLLAGPGRSVADKWYRRPWGG